MKMKMTLDQRGRGLHRRRKGGNRAVRAVLAVLLCCLLVLPSDALVFAEIPDATAGSGGFAASADASVTPAEGTAAAEVATVAADAATAATPAAADEAASAPHVAADPAPAEADEAAVAPDGVTAADPAAPDSEAATPGGAPAAPDSDADPGTDPADPAAPIPPGATGIGEAASADVTARTAAAAAAEERSPLEAALEARGLNALAVGDTFKSVSDEGVEILFLVTGPATVQVGSGARVDAGDYLNDPATSGVTINPDYTGSLSIPSQVTHEGVTYTVTAISGSAFSYFWASSIAPSRNYRFSRILLPPSVTSIGAYAFSGQASLAAIDFPSGSGLTTIGDHAFSSTARLTSFTVPSTVTSLGSSAFEKSLLERIEFEAPCNLTQMSSSVFLDSQLKEIELPSSITSLGVAAFNNTQLTSFHIPAQVTDLGTSLFSNNLLLTDLSIDAASPVTTLPVGFLSGCVALSDFTINPTITRIERAAFQGTGLTSIFIPAATVAFDVNTFSDCRYLASVTFEEGSPLMVLSGRMFAGCVSLESIKLPANLRVLGSYAFANCTALSSISLPAALTDLGVFTFQGASSLQTVIFEGDASALSADYSVFYLCDAIANVVYQGKKSRQISFISSSPTIYYTIAFYANRAEIGGAPVGLYSVRADAIPAAPYGGDVFQGAIPGLDGGFKWVYEEGYYITDEMTDSYYAFAQSRDSDLTLGASFTANTVETTPVTYTVVGLPNGLNSGAVTVGGAADASAAIALGTTGQVTLPRVVTGPDGLRYTVVAIAPGAFKDCASFVAITIPATVTSVGLAAFQRCTMLRRIVFEGNAPTIAEPGAFNGSNSVELVIFGGKKAPVSFGISTPQIYYTVRYYESERDLYRENVLATLVVKERSVLERLSADQLYAGAIPELQPGFTWKYEEGFGPSTPLTDSCEIYAEGLGFRVDIPVELGNSTTTALCWFRITGFDAATGTGTVQAGLGIDAVTAVPQFTRGVPVLPATVTDEAGNRYTVTAISSYAFGSSAAMTACAYVTTVRIPDTVTSIGASAFENCALLSSITIPTSVETLGDAICHRCPALRDVIFTQPSKVKVIPESAFADDRALLSFEMPVALERIGAGAFGGDDRLTWLTLPPNFRRFDDAAFMAAFRIREITFEGDASQVSVGRSALFMDWSITVLSQVARVNYMDKKSPEVEAGIYPYNDSGQPLNPHGRTWYQYYNVKMYASKSDFNAGRQSSNLLVREDVVLEQAMPSPGVNGAWVCEPGFSVREYATNSFYAYAGADIGLATISGVENEYYYTGEYIRPLPLLTMPDGTVLRFGVDYALDVTQGLNRDGYVNNRREGTAGIHMVGIGDYAGTKVASFGIRGVVDTSTSMTVEFLGSENYVYTGLAITPRVRVWVTLHGETRAGVAGSDYRLRYYDNVNANQTRGGAPARVEIVGLGAFGGTRSAEFNINPYPLSRCEVTGSLTVSEAGFVSDPQVTVVHTSLGRTLQENEDYTVNVRGILARDSTIFVTGQGNYTGVRRLGGEVSSGTGGGVGGGDGTGIGTGIGSGVGAGTGTAGGTSGTGGNSADLVSVEGVEGGGGGSGGAYPSYNISEILLDEQEEDASSLPTVDAVLSFLRVFFWILVAISVLAGAFWRLRLYLTALDPPQPS